MLSLLLNGVGCATQSVSMKADPVTKMNVEKKSTYNDYRLQVRDVIEIKFFHNPEFNERVMIRPDGKISLQLLDDVQASGLTPMELDKVITEKYREPLLEPKVTVIVREIGAKVFVGGQVRRPGIIAYDRPLTALQAVFMAGGFMDTSEPSSVILIRKNVNDKITAMKIDLKKVLTIREPERDIPLHPTDILFVPKSNIAKINQFTEQYVRGVFPLQMGFTGIDDWFLGMGFTAP